MTPEISVFTLLVLLLTFVLTILGAQVLRRQQRVQLALRRIRAYQAMPVAVSEAVEGERPIHVSFGGSGLGAASTISALAVADLLYPLVERAAIAAQPPIISLSDPTTLGLAQGTLRRAYERRNNLEAYRSTAVRWYPQGQRSLAFAAGVAGALADEDSNLSVAAGRFGPEIAFIGEMTMRYDQLFFGQSDQLDGQAVAYVMSERPLIGEELYVAGAYLPRRPSPLHLSQLLAMEGLRFIVIATILLVAVGTFVAENIVLILAAVVALVVITGALFGLRYLRQRREG